RRLSVLRVALTRSSGLLCRGRPRGGRTGSRRLAAELSSLARGSVAFRLAAPRSALLAAAALLVDGRPSPPFGFLLGDPARLVALGDMIGFALLLAGVFGLVTTWHDHPPLRYER